MQFLLSILITVVSIYTFTMIYAKQSKQTATDYAVFQSTLLLSEIIGSSLYDTSRIF